MKNKTKLASLAMAALLAMGSNQAVAENQTDCESCGDDALPGATETAPGVPNKALARQKLVDALKSMKNNPEEIQFHSAMCYKMSMPPATFEYSCPDCGTKTSHEYQSTAGKLARQIVTIRRSLPNLPVKISVNETSLCQKCSKSKNAELTFTSECGKCQTIFSWKIGDYSEIEKLGWLFLNYPVKSLDSGAGRGELTDPPRVRAMVEFVSSCTFCPKCIAELQLNYEK
ncbi:MAG: hypothetical protein KKB51_18910 [Candidatus Riflebacteria bacterium]|nr:hypothetical protein [Candidatus Riflebacteria bacterium]